MYLVVSVFTSRPTSLLLSERASIFLRYLCFVYYTKIVSRDKDLMNSIHLKSFLIFLDLPDSVF
jgi:hypothetical protein